jgi:hypothetical protein
MNKGERSMDEHQQTKRFVDKSTKAARETIERGVLAAEEAAKGTHQSFSSLLASTRELNIKLIEDLAHEVASAQGPTDLIARATSLH